LRFDAVADFLEGPCDRIFLATGLDGFFAFAEGLFALGFLAFVVRVYLPLLLPI